MQTDVVSLYLNWQIQQDIKKTMEKISALSKTVTPPQASADNPLLAQTQILSSNLTQYPAVLGQGVDQIINKT